MARRYVFEKTWLNHFGLYSKHQVDKMESRIVELWDALNDAESKIEVYGNMADYEANPEWEPPVYLRNGAYTTEERLADIRRHSKILMECADEIRKVLFK